MQQVQDDVGVDVVCGIAWSTMGGPWRRRAPQSAPMSPPSPPSPAQPRNPLHGKTLEAILTELVAHFGWDGLAQRVALRCFSSDPSIGSSLKVLRKTPWAREKVEGLYLFMLRDRRRAGPPRRPG
jgi:hypothetical protein